MTPKPGVAIHHNEKQNHGLESALDHELIAAAQPSIENGQPVRLERSVRNVDRTVGAMLSGEVAKRHGHAGLPEDTISVKFTGTAGQSFGAFLARGVSIELTGDANDYVGKGLSGGRIVVKPPKGLRAIRPRTSLSATRFCMAPSRAKPISMAWRASVSPCAIPARSAWWKAPATMAANI